jgi:hypothetical protein
VSEAEGAAKLLSFRQQLTGFVGPSFDTISSTGANGAVIHYKPPDVGSKPIDVDAMYLCDSGGQFKCVVPFLPSRDTLSLSLSPTLSLSHPHSLSLTHTLSLSHPHSLSHTHTPSLTQGRHDGRDAHGAPGRGDGAPAALLHARAAGIGFKCPHSNRPLKPLTPLFNLAGFVSWCFTRVLQASV